MNGMKRVNAILAHPLYRECYARLEELEKDRIFCRHQMTHLLDVARIAYISNMEQGQYEDGTPHEQSGEKIASEILGSLSEKDAFSDEENRMILTAIRGHRRLREDADVLEKLLYTSDKASRMCFACPAEGECDWSTEKKNMELKI